MSYTNEQVAHVYACGYIESKAESFRFLYVNADLSNSDASSSITAPLYSERPDSGYDGCIFWIYPATETGAETGSFHIASSLSVPYAYSHDGRDKAHNLYSTGTSIATRLRLDNEFSQDERFYLIKEDDDNFSIESVSTGLTIEVDTSTGEITQASHTGDDNQCFHLHVNLSSFSGGYLHGGCFNVVPSLDESQAIQSLTTTPNSYAEFGAAAQKQPHNVMTLEFFERMTSTSDMNSTEQANLAYQRNRAGSLWNRIELYDETTMRGQFASGGTSKTEYTFQTRLGALLYYSQGLVSISGIAGTYYTRTLKYNASSTNLFLSSYDGTNDLGLYPTFQSADTTSSTQAWGMLPQNVFDSELPVPFDLRCSLVANNISYDLTSTQTLPVEDDTSVSMSVSFNCENDQYLILVKRRYLIDNIWSDVVDVLEPTTQNLTATSAAPFAKLAGGPAWIPNAWGNEDVSIVLGELFSGYDNATACMLTVSVASMRNGDWTGLPGVPYEGMTVSQSYVIARNVSCTFDDATVEYDGIHIPTTLTGTNSARLHLDEFALFDDTTMNSYLLQSGYDIEIDSDTTSIVIPFTALQYVDSTLMSASESPYRLAGTLYTNFGSDEILFTSGTITSSMSSISVNLNRSDFGGYVLPTSTSMSRYTPVACYQYLPSERSGRYISLNPLIGGGYPWYRIVGSYTREDDTVQCALMILLSSSSYRYAIISQSQPERLVAGLYRRIERTYDANGVIDSGDDIQIIPLQGNLTFTYSAKSDFASARRLGGRYSIVGATGGQQSDMKFSGTIFKGQLQDIEGDSNDYYSISTDIQTLYNIRSDEDLILRTTYGTAYMVRLVGVSSPRDTSDLANITLELIEVE